MTNNQQQPSDLDLLVKQVIQSNHVDVPIMATRIVGKQLKIFLYGGQVIRVAIDAIDPRPPNAEPPPTNARPKNLAARIKNRRGAKLVPDRG